MFMATTWKSTPELCTINLFEHFWTILVIRGSTYTESNIKSHSKLLFKSQKYIIAQYLHSGNIISEQPLHRKMIIDNYLILYYIILPYN